MIPSKRIFVAAPPNIYSLDVVIPILYELKARYEEIRVTFIFTNENEFIRLKENEILFKLVQDAGEIKTFFGIRFLGRLAKPLNKTLKLIQIIPALISMGAFPSLLFYPRRIEVFLDRIMAWANHFRGKTYCYLNGMTSFQDELIRYFDKDGKLRPGMKPKDNSFNTANGLLVYHRENIKFLELMGYKGPKYIIGYPIMYPAFQNKLKKISNTEFHEKKVISIFLNKYSGKWANRDDQWAKDRLKELIACCLKRYPGCVFLLKAHPKLPAPLVESLIPQIQGAQIHITQSSPSALASISHVVIALAQSSSFLHVMAFGCPYIEYGELDPYVYDLFPEGSLYWDFGIFVAKHYEDLENALIQIDQGNTQLDLFHKRLKHQTDFSVFDAFWEESPPPLEKLKQDIL